MSILEPVELVIENFEEHFDSDVEISIPNHPKDETMGHSISHLSKTFG